jgi:hypothetical protein
MRNLRVLFGLVMLCVGAAANADVGMSLRAGTLGAGADVNFGLTETLNLRLGYSMYSYDETVEETDVTYDGELKLSNASALLDWHVFNGGFRLSFGAVGGGTEVDVVGVPAPNNTFDIGDETFLASEVGNLTGKIEMGNSVSPYFGFGWGNTVDKAGRITFLFDLGVVYTGSPDVSLDVNCGVTTASRCNLLRAEVQKEEDEIATDATEYELWPVVSLGLAIRF